MLLTELIPKVNLLPRADKLRLLQLLVAELAEEDVALLTPNREYSIWTPLNAFGAAGTLMMMLENHKATSA